MAIDGFIIAFITWQGTPVNGPVFIYHRELLQAFITRLPSDLNGPGILACRSNQTVYNFDWRYVNNNSIIPYSPTQGNYYQIGERNGANILVRRRDHATGPNGLWPCRIRVGTIEGSSFAGLYSDGMYVNAA